jgi:D-tyrosyl-tRNA(Tyr) deacylase
LKAVVQRVKNASVTIKTEQVSDRIQGTDRISGRIDRGLLVYLGVARGDTEDDARRLAEKIAVLRIFEDNEGKMNLSIREAGGSVLAVSQFTLLADARKGRRPYYGEAADPDSAKALYEYFMDRIRKAGLICESGVFQARMEVAYINDGPVTILLDSRELPTAS